MLQLQANRHLSFFTGTGHQVGNRELQLSEAPGLAISKSWARADAIRVLTVARVPARPAGAPAAVGVRITVT